MHDIFQTLFETFTPKFYSVYIFKSGKEGIEVAGFLRIEEAEKWINDRIESDPLFEDYKDGEVSIVDTFTGQTKYITTI